jgi:hypothetical protein
VQGRHLVSPKASLLHWGNNFADCLVDNYNCALTLN